jgi:ferredoxin-NADP reductase
LVDELVALGHDEPLRLSPPGFGAPVPDGWAATFYYYAAWLVGEERVSVRPQDEYGLLDLPSLLGRPQRRTAVYTCGPEPLLAAVESGCEKWPSGALHVERFAAKKNATDRPRTTFEVELATR